MNASGLPVDLAPRDGTMVWLLIDYGAKNAPWCPLVDAKKAWTIGFNNLDNDGEDEWKFAGWDWQQDYFTEGSARPLAWRPVGFDLDAGEGDASSPSEASAGNPATDEQNLPPPSPGGEQEAVAWTYEYTNHLPRSEEIRDWNRAVAFDPPTPARIQAGLARNVQALVLASPVRGAGEEEDMAARGASVGRGTLPTPPDGLLSAGEDSNSETAEGIEP